MLLLFHMIFFSLLALRLSDVYKLGTFSKSWLEILCMLSFVLLHSFHMRSCFGILVLKSARASFAWHWRRKTVCRADGRMYHCGCESVVLQLIKEAQSQHGLRHGDYQRYRSCYPSFLVFKAVLYCFRKVCTLLLLFRHLIDITRTVLG